MSCQWHQEAILYDLGSVLPLSDELFVQRLHGKVFLSVFPTFVPSSWIGTHSVVAYFTTVIILMPTQHGVTPIA